MFDLMETCFIRGVARANRRDWSTCAIGAFTPDLGHPCWTRVLPMSWWSDGNRAWFTTGDGFRSKRVEESAAGQLVAELSRVFWGSLREIPGPP